MRLTNLCKPAGAVAITTCAVATGIAVNLSILSAGPDGAGTLSVGTQRPTTTIAAPARSHAIALPPLTVSRLVLHLAPPPAAVVALTTTTNGRAPTTAQPVPFDVPPSGTASTTTAPPTPTTAPSTTTTSVPVGPPTRTYRVLTAGTVTTQWLDRETIELTARAARGWNVTLTRDRGQHVKATFTKPGVRVLWAARVTDTRSLRVEVRRFVVPTPRGGGDAKAHESRDHSATTTTPPRPR